MRWIAGPSPAMTTEVSLTRAERAMLAGAEGPALQLAMRLVLKAADIMGATELVPIGFAHLDACFYAGEAHVDFARFMLENRGRFAVPTWTNATVVSKADPDLRPCAKSPVSAAASTSGHAAPMSCSRSARPSTSSNRSARRHPVHGEYLRRP